jgi:predicted AAA+ superfamily ATPase
MFDELIEHLRDDIEKIDDARAKAMFETSAEVIIGLKKAFEHFEAGEETAWQK